MKTVLPLLIALVLTTSTFGQMTRLPNSVNRTINVSGRAAIDVTPDKVVISLGIVTNDMDIQVAKKQNATILQKSMAIFKDLKIESKFIQTDQLTIEPRYRVYDNKDHFLGYWVTNNIAVTLTDVKQVEPVITRGLEAGVNYVHGVDFQVTDFKKYRQQARIMAVKAAREKAQDMVEVLGLTVGKPTYINEGSSGMYSNHYGRRNSHLMVQNAISNQTQGGEMQGTVAIGKVRIQASVNVVFQIVEGDPQIQTTE